MSRARFLVLAAAYCLFHLVMRGLMTPNIGTDEVEQAVMAQSWAWVYNIKQPPLFTWLLLAVDQMVGTSGLAFALVKYSLLFVFFWLAFEIGRLLWRDDGKAGLAAFSYLLLYQIGWQTHAGFTHTITLIVACLLTLYAFLLIGAERRGGFIWLGLAVGLGILSKYGYLVTPLCLGLAALTEPDWRRRLLRPGWLAVAALLALLLAGPHLFYLWQARQAFQSVVSGTLATSDWHGPLRWLIGWGSFTLNSIAYGMPLLALAVLINWRAFDLRARQVWPDDRAARLIGRSLLVAFVATVIAIPLFGLASFKERWLHPFYIFLPLWLCHRLFVCGWNAKQQRWLVGLILGTCAVVVVIRFGQQEIGPPFCGHCRTQINYPALARALETTGSAPATLVAEDEHLAGNLKLAWPRSRILTPIYDFYLPPKAMAASGDCLLVWRSAPNMPPGLSALLAKDGVALTDLAGNVTTLDIASDDRPAFVTRFYAQRLVKACPSLAEQP